MRLSSIIGKQVKMAEPRFDQDVIENIGQILESGQLRSGNVIHRFEDCFAKRLDASYGCAVSSGTAALHLALESCVEPGTEVIVPAFSFFASASTVLHAGCTPVFVDVDPNTFLMDLDQVEEKITRNTSTILPVNLFGNIVDPERVDNIATEHDLMVVYDSAQSIGSTFKGWESGKFGDMSCFSFYPTKMITTGEGGLVATNDKRLHSLCESLRSHGESGKYMHVEVGYNYRSTEIAGALGLSQLQKLDRYVEKRRIIARYYDLAIGNIKGLSAQQISESVESSYNYYTIKVSENNGCSRDELHEKLVLEGIETGIHYPRPLNKQPALQSYADESCPVAEELSKTVLSLPIHPFLTSIDTERVVTALRNAMN